MTPTPVHNTQEGTPDTPTVPRVKSALKLPPRVLPLTALLLVAAGGAFVLTRPHDAPAPVMDTTPISTPVKAPLGTTVTTPVVPPRKATAPLKTIKPTSTPEAPGGLKTERVGTVNNYAVTPAILDPFVAPTSLPGSAQRTAPLGGTPTGALPSLPASLPRTTSAVTPVATQSAPAAIPTYRTEPITAAPTPTPLPLTPIPARVSAPATLPSFRSVASLAVPMPSAPRALPGAAPRPLPLPVPAPLVLTPARTPAPPAAPGPAQPNAVPGTPVNATPAQPGLAASNPAPTPIPSAPKNPAEQWVKDNAVTYAGRAEGSSVVAILTTRYGTVYADDAQTIPGSEVTVTNTTPKSVELTLGEAHTTLPLSP